MKKIKKLLLPETALIILLFWETLANVVFFSDIANIFTKIIGVYVFVTAMINIKKIKLNRDKIILLAFLFSVGLSDLFNYKSSLYSNLIYLFFMVIYIFIGLEVNFKSIVLNKKIINPYIFLVIICSIFSIVTYVFKLDLNYNNVYFGLHWDVLYGVFLNPNTGSIIAYFAIILLFIQYCYERKNITLFYIFIEIIYLILADSRGTFITIITFFSIFFFMVKIYEKKYFKCIVIGILGIILMLLFIINSPINIIKKFTTNVNSFFYSKIELDDGKVQDKSNIENEVNKHEKIESNIDSQISDEKDKVSYSQNNTTDMVNEQQDFSKKESEPDISSSRFTLWKAGLKVARNNLLFGVGKAEEMNYVREYLDPTSGEYNIVAGGVHNGYIDLLVSNGIISILLFLIFIIRRFICFLKNFKNEKFNLFYVFSFSAFISILVNNLVETSFFNAIFITCIFFWCFSGNILNEEDSVDYFR